MPLFSIIIPTFNRGNLITETINSVLSQSFKDYEIIAADDGSTDDTQEILKSYKEKIRYMRQENKGAEAVRNLGAKIAEGDYFLFLDSDDLLLPDALSVYKKIIEGCGHPSLIVGKVIEIGDKKKAKPDPVDKKIRIIRLTGYVKKDRPVHKTCSVILISKSLFNKIGGFRIGTFPVEDLDLLLRADGKGNVLIVDNPPTIAYRLHGENSLKQINSVVEKLIFLASEEKRKLHSSLDRKALIGGSLLNWLSKSIKAGSIKNASAIIRSGMPEIIIAVIRKSLTGLKVIKHNSEEVKSK